MKSEKNPKFWSRREFLEFIGASGLLCSGSTSALAKVALSDALSPNMNDTLSLMNGLSYQAIASATQSIGAIQFGGCCDFTAFVPMSDDEGILWVNHESPEPSMLVAHGDKKTKAQIDMEMAQVGGSLLHLKKVGDEWQLVEGSKMHRRLDGKSQIPFVGLSSLSKYSAKGAKSNPALPKFSHATGMIANCAGGVTPWGHVLSCEENYDEFYGDTAADGHRIESDLGWETAYKHAPEHYGWVVEVEPKTGKAKKLLPLGRFAHEGAAVTKAKNGKVVVYMGDDSNDCCLYKFVSDHSDSLESGTLYAADTMGGRWIPLVHAKHEILQKHFRDQLDVLVHARAAAKLVGASALDRPEGIAIRPSDNMVVVSLTNNKGRDDHYGSLLRLSEEGDDPGSMKFASATLVTGGKESGFACPDNLCFDPSGGLWMTTDVSDSAMGKAPYEYFGNNTLFYIPIEGTKAGTPVRVAVAPKEAEFTGPSFTKDGKTLFLSVQHPGALTRDLSHPTSKFPDGKTLGRSTVVAISGQLLSTINS